MAFVFRPGQIAQRASFYHQLSSLITAGVTLERGLDSVRHSRAGPLGTMIRDLQQRLQSGQTLGQAVHQMRRWIPEFDAALLQAGEESGRLDVTLRALGNYYDERARLMRRMVLMLVYPVVLIHALILIFPVSNLVHLVHTFEIGPFLVSKLILAGIIDGAIVLAILAAQGSHGDRWRTFLELLSRRVPVFGKARQSMALARTSLALEGLINAGVNIVQAWEMAAGASGSPLLRREVQSWKPSLEAGCSPGELVLQSREFPEEFASQYHSAEMSGKLDETLTRLHTVYQEEATRKFSTAAAMLAGIIFATVIVVIVYQVFSFYLGYFSQIMDVL